MKVNPTDIRQVLAATNDGEMTIALMNEQDVRNVRKKYSAKLQILSLKPKKGAPITFVRADDIDTYNAITKLVTRYKELESTGHLIDPMPAAS